MIISTYQNTCLKCDGKINQAQWWSLDAEETKAAQAERERERERAIFNRLSTVKNFMSYLCK